MGISVGCLVLSRVVDTLFGDLKQKCVYSFMDDLVVYSSSLIEHFGHLEEVFKRSVWIKRKFPFWDTLCRLRERTDAIRNFPPPKNLKEVRRFLEMA
jgi:hypothetical protein